MKNTKLNIGLDEATSSFEDLTDYENAIRNEKKLNLSYCWMDIAGSYFIVNLIMMIRLLITSLYFVPCVDLPILYYKI